MAIQGSGTSLDPFTIETAIDLLSLDKIEYTSKYIKLEANIDLTDYSIRNIFTNTFSGTFDGNGFTISNCALTGNIDCGFFKNVRGGTIKDLTIENFSVTRTGIAQTVGLFVTYDYGGIYENITFNKCTMKSIYNGGMLISVKNTQSVIHETQINNVEFNNCAIDGRSVGLITGVIKGANSYKIIINNIAINGCTIKSSSTSGLVLAHSQSSLEIYNIFLSNSELIGESSSGGIIGGAACNNLLIENIRVSNQSKIKATGNYVGAIAGFASISNSLTIRKISISGSHIEGKTNVGSIIGKIVNNNTILPAKIELCSVFNNTIHSTGDFLGGFIGSTNKCILSNSYLRENTLTSDLQTTGLAIANIIGQTTDSVVILNVWTKDHFINQTNPGIDIKDKFASTVLANVFMIGERTVPVTIPGIKFIQNISQITKDNTPSLDWNNVWNTINNYPELIDMLEIDDYYISGKVLRDGKPQAGAIVYLFGSTNKYTKTTTDKNGDYIFKSILPDREFVIVSHYYNTTTGEVYVTTSNPGIIPVKI